MYKYGQYCPVAQALELIGDRWTLLIIRDMLTGTRHFNDLARGLPGISRTLLAKRLKQLEDASIITKGAPETGRRTTQYQLTESGIALVDVINALMIWGANWAFDDPTFEQLNPLLLMWWIHNRVRLENLPQDSTEYDARTTIQFDFYGAAEETYWLVLSSKEASLCLTDPGYEINIVVTADLATFFKVWLGRMEFSDAIAQDKLRLDGAPQLVRAFPDWFAWSPAAEAVRSARFAHAS